MNFIARYFFKGNCLKTSIKAEVDGVKIIDPFNDNTIFSDAITSSLKMVKEYNPIIYKKIIKNIQYIIHRDYEEAPPHSEITFPKEKWCLIKYDVFTNEQLLLCAYYSGLLIRSSIKSHLYSKNIQIKNNNIQRVYELSLIQQNRFYRKFEDQNPKYKGSFTNMEHDFTGLRKLTLAERLKNYYKAIIKLIKDLKE